MRRLVAGMFTVGLAISMVGTADAQTRDRLERRGYIGGGAGVTIPMGDYGDLSKLGWMGHVFGGYTTSGGLLGGRIDASYGQNKLDGADGSVKLLGATGNLVLTPGHRPAKVHPYLLGGVGVFHATSTGGSGETALALNGGAGIQIHLGHRSDVFAEGRFLTILTDNTTSLIPITVGFRWGGI